MYKADNLIDAILEKDLKSVEKELKVIEEYRIDYRYLKYLCKSTPEIFDLVINHKSFHFSSITDPLFLQDPIPLTPTSKEFIIVYESQRKDLMELFLNCKKFDINKKEDMPLVSIFNHSKYNKDMIDFILENKKDVIDLSCDNNHILDVMYERKKSYEDLYGDRLMLSYKMFKYSKKISKLIFKEIFLYRNTLKIISLVLKDKKVKKLLPHSHPEIYNKILQDKIGEF